MAENRSPFTCDICGIHKKEQNHWFRVWIDEIGIINIAPWTCTAMYDLGRITPDHSHCCGEEHALRKAGELLGKLKASDS